MVEERPDGGEGEQGGGVEVALPSLLLWSLHVLHDQADEGRGDQLRGAEDDPEGGAEGEAAPVQAEQEQPQGQLDLTGALALPVSRIATVGLEKKNVRKCLVCQLNS